MDAVFSRLAGCWRVISSCLTAVLIASALTGAGGRPAAGATPLKIVYPQPSAATTPLWLAHDQGFFARQGLDVSLTQVTGSSAVATISSGESQILFAGATEVADFDATGGDLAMIAGAENYPVFSLYVSKDINTVQDLVGKKIAVTRSGTSTDTTARIILEHYGLTGKVDIISSGGTLAGVMAAVTSGVAAGGILSPPTTAKAEAAGLKELVNGVRLGVPMAALVMSVRRSYLEKNRDTVMRALKAYVDAWGYVRNPASEAAAESAIVHYTKVSPEDAAVAYRAFLPVWQAKVPRVDGRGVQNVLRFSANPQVRKMLPASLIDDSLLQELVRSGYVK
jgi:ABC-type nitrate/sulfonate/bicarbonate transport system substrate-binding protein